MTLRDSEGDIDVPIGAYFRCKIGELPAALVEVVFPYRQTSGVVGVVCCRVREGSLPGVDGEQHGPGALFDSAADRVAAAVRRFRNSRVST